VTKEKTRLANLELVAICERIPYLRSDLLSIENHTVGTAAIIDEVTLIFVFHQCMMPGGLGILVQ
jgi:hypothetical protein